MKASVALVASLLVSVCNYSSSNELLSIDGFQDTVSDMAFSPDGSMILTGCFDGTAELRDSENGALLFSFKLPENGNLYSVDFSSDGSKFLLSGAQWENDTMVPWYNGLYIFDSQTHELLREFTNSSIQTKFSPDGTKIFLNYARPGREQLISIDADTGEYLRLYNGCRYGALDFDLSPDGTLLSMGANKEAFTIVWNLDQDTWLYSLDHTPLLSISAVQFTPDSRYILAADQGTGTIRKWNAETGKTELLFSGYNKGISALKVSPDGERAVSVSPTDICLWDVNTGTRLATLVSANSILSDGLNLNTENGVVAFSPDSAKLAVGGLDDSVRILDISDVAISPNNAGTRFLYENTFDGESLANNRLTEIPGGFGNATPGTVQFGKPSRLIPNQDGFVPEDPTSSNGEGILVTLQPGSVSLLIGETVESNQPVTIDCFAYISEQGTTVTLGLIDSDNSGSLTMTSYVNKETRPDGFQRITASFQAPSGTLQPFVQASSPVGGVVFIDNLRVYELPSSNID